MNALDIKTIFFVLLTIIKAIVIIIGVGLIIKNFVSGIRDKDSDGKERAVKYFLLMLATLLLLTLIEFAIVYILPTQG